MPALIRAWRGREAPPERFLLAWLIPAWVLLELVPTKLPHYVLPLYPALSLLVAIGFNDGAARVTRLWARRVDFAVTVLWAAAGLAVAALLVVLPLRFGGYFSVTGMAGALVLMALIAATLWHRRSVTGLAAIPTMTLVFTVTAAWAVLPGLDRLWLSRSAAVLVAQHKPAAGTPLVAVGYSEPSLVFLLGDEFASGDPAHGHRPFGCRRRGPGQQPAKTRSSGKRRPRADSRQSPSETCRASTTRTASARC